MYMGFKTALPDKNGEIYKPKVAVATNKIFRKIRCSLSLAAVRHLDLSQMKGRELNICKRSDFLKHVVYADLNICKGEIF
jgi:hypothetical protein